MTWRLRWVSVRSFGFEDSLTSVFVVLAAIKLSVSISGLGEMFVSFMEHLESGGARNTYP